MDFSYWLLGRSRIYFSKVVSLASCSNPTKKNRKYLFMVRLILILVLILFIIWILRPFLKTKNGNEKNNKLEDIMNSGKSTFMQPNTFFIILSVVLLFSLFLWLLPKLGINLLSLFQKIIPLLSTLRGILPF